MNVICNNCGGADFYHLSNEPYNNPFMWSMILADDMIELIDKYDSINFNNFELTRLTAATAIANNFYRFDENKKMLGLKIDNKFTVYYTHYIYDARYKEPKKIGPDVCYYRNFEYVYEKYVERLKRMSGTPTFIIIAFKRYGWTEEKITKLLSKNPKYKVFLITNVKCQTDKENFEIIYNKQLDSKFDESPITYIKKYYNRINDYVRSNECSKN